MTHAPPDPELLSRYAEPQRRHHTLAHIEDCLVKLAAVPGLTAEERRRLEAAVWWHDAVYDPMRSDNEERSADLAERALAEAGESPEACAEAARLIRLTAGHRVESGDRLGAVLVSIDLSILGASPEAYDRYAEAIRAEYAHVPEPLYRAGRAAVLRRFLANGPIFPEPGFEARYEAAARENMGRELAALDA